MLQAGKARKALYFMGPGGPETNTTVIALGPPFPSESLATPPRSIGDAMAGTSIHQAVLLLYKCKKDPGARFLPGMGLRASLQFTNLVP